MSTAGVLHSSRYCNSISISELRGARGTASNVRLYNPSSDDDPASFRCDTTKSTGTEDVSTLSAW